MIEVLCVFCWCLGEKKNGNWPVGSFKYETDFPQLEFHPTHGSQLPTAVAIQLVCTVKPIDGADRGLSVYQKDKANDMV